RLAVSLRSSIAKRRSHLNAALYYFKFGIIMKNKTLFGLKVDSDVKAYYCVSRKKVVRVEGATKSINSDIRVSDSMNFNLPVYIEVNGFPYYPTKYEISSGEVIYHHSTPVMNQIALKEGPLEQDMADIKNMEVTITPKTLKRFNKSQKSRPRQPSQNQVMKGSAKSHVQPLIDNGTIIINQGSVPIWHWCHLVAFTLTSSKVAQNSENLIAGTSAFNGQMANIEAAVKKFVNEYNTSLKLEIEVYTIVGTSVGKRMRYRIAFPGLMYSYTEYYDPLSSSKSDYKDAHELYENLVKEYKYILNELKK
uniref:hypothetical protein n=1 Tax=Vibrio parahaemolyticus TaxID=670 RepID=UPI001E575550